ncbi:MAG TPA: MaoC/PaaZ C-terminal domain-containing protein [Solirubrobacterales bacterium]|jgi:3-hydroxybutyryl-CoA dehydratase|nr:MaoC/PaaZ C-terminal domain-containing protein [Solirubrobacterales bacterium]
MIEDFRSPGRTITESDLVSFSALTGDWHPQHTDVEWARQSQFSERVAHGMLVLSYSIGLAPLDPERVVALRGFDSVTFKRPVLIGDTIRVEGSVEGTRPLSEGLELVDITWRILNQDDRMVARAVVHALCRADESPAEGGRNGAGEGVGGEVLGLGDQRVDGADLYGDRILL